MSKLDIWVNVLAALVLIYLGAILFVHVIAQSDDTVRVPYECEYVAPADGQCT